MRTQRRLHFNSGENNGNAVLNEAVVRKLRAEFKKAKGARGVLPTIIKKVLGRKKAKYRTVRSAVLGHTWSHVK